MRPCFRYGALVLLATPLIADAAGGLPLMSSTPAAGGGQNYSLSLQMLLFMTGLTFIPAMMLMMTAFTRIIIVMSLLRQAMGTMQSPPNQVIVGLSLFLTLFVMGPTFDQVYAKAWVPFSDDKITLQQAVDEASKPMKAFMLRQTREKDLAFFIEISQSEKPQTKADVSMKTLVPAYVISELKTAFQIGFMVFIPFLIIDLVVASILMAMGMMMVSPVTISLPFKLMLFVLVDGWTLLMGSLVQSFYTG
ncbi:MULTISPECIES: flagellar type III secretion system pore protein FliP [Chromobacterium]|uniref:Flagellar biosynthetic protein FliP n=1 Tax=Chromobacterium rhizoryzae TaxID=1778675 RepID=A0AAD0RU12_9NEIS|nr:MULTISPECIES: flagellar type III secretion system pore protein FliP [Chromobacterium]AXT47071.1 flagellar biosynthetic protein FliP [Chromobacterium rhizoryzae]MDH0342709.1 flagellar type III secretion system pore protein FliP [Chromobacterium haemolyticum]OQS36705.1 flagellar biosynthetic protein FliP [Chromobacterium haemolyticum]PTU70901.1 flagellar biosynthetic protein FliP [Chromobacterium haemolyticum]QOD80895.1 flagellar type III secretion system pore protein FliP [Chromobacterium ha